MKRIRLVGSFVLSSIFVSAVSCGNEAMRGQMDEDLTNYLEKHEDLGNFLDVNPHEYTFRYYTEEYGPRTFVIRCMPENGVIVGHEEILNSGETRFYMIQPVDPERDHKGGYRYSLIERELSEEELEQALLSNFPDEFSDYELEWESWDNEFREYVRNNLLSL